MSKLQTISEKLKEYREAAIGASEPNPEKQNEWARKVHDCYKQLRESKEWRNGIIGLMSDPNPHVKVWAASHSLQWVPEKARSVLEGLRDSHGQESFTAKWTLKEFESGRLSFDYWKDLALVALNGGQL
jgi:hypothetical protein